MHGIYWYRKMTLFSTLLLEGGEEGALDDQKRNSHIFALKWKMHISHFFRKVLSKKAMYLLPKTPWLSEAYMKEMTENTVVRPKTKLAKECQNRNVSESKVCMNLSHFRLKPYLFYKLPTLVFKGRW